MKLPVPMLSERGTTVGSKATVNQHVPSTAGGMSPSVKFTVMPNKDYCMFTRLYFQLDPSRYGDSATHQQVSKEQRCSPSSLQTQSGVMQHKANCVLRQTSKAPNGLQQWWPIYAQRKHVPNCLHNLMTFCKNQYTDLKGQGISFIGSVDHIQRVSCFIISACPIQKV